MNPRVDPTTLAELLRREVSDYAGEAVNGMLYYTENPHQHVYCVTATYNNNEEKADLVMMARLINDQIVIDADKTSKPLCEELRRAGIPDEQIELAYERKGR